MVCVCVCVCVCVYGVQIRTTKNVPMVHMDVNDERAQLWLKRLMDSNFYLTFNVVTVHLSYDRGNTHFSLYCISLHLDDLILVR